MCGIFCAINLNASFDSKDYKKFVELTDLVSYRGPDSAGYLGLNVKSKEKNSNSFNIFLGHRRLSIIDLSEDGNQPMVIDEIALIFNGEIFNYIELRDELKKQGESFSTNTDSEVLIKIYKVYGENGFSKLNGMWAFILVDLKLNKVVASRDRFSIKPLFYLRNKNDLFFSSEIKQLLPLLPVKNINYETIQVFLQQGLLDINDQTFFENIYKVKPKHNFIVDLKSKKIEERKYWDYEISDLLNKEDELIEQFSNLLYDSINIRLRSDVEVGTLLSGGLDSSTISLITKEITKNSLRSFSVVSDDKKFSEEEFIDELIKSSGIKNEKYFVNTDSLKSDLDKVIYHQDEPFNNFIILAHYNLLKQIKENSKITVILNGQGGDEVLMGYLRFYFFYWKSLAKEKHFVKLFQELAASVFNRTAIFQFNLGGAKRYIPQILKKDKKYLKTRSDLVDVWNFTNLREAQINDIDKYSVPILTRYEDRNSMAHSQEIRLPFLDHRLVNFLISISVNHKMKNGWSKYILRKSQPNLPSKIRWRRDKKGFVLPEKKWLQVDFREEILNYHKSGSSKLSQFGLIDDKAFLEYYNLFLSGSRKIHTTDISRIFITEKWLRTHFN